MLRRLPRHHRRPSPSPSSTSNSSTFRRAAAAAAHTRSRANCAGQQLQMASADERGAKRPKLASAPQQTDNLRVTGINPLLPPACLSEDLPLDSALGTKINAWRDSIGKVRRGAAAIGD
eukprot:SAG31_NODE_2666_length_5273_cov_2.404716_9_plen_119_part_00